MEVRELALGHRSINCQLDFEPSWSCCSPRCSLEAHNVCHNMFCVMKQQVFKLSVFAKVICSFFQIPFSSSHALSLSCVLLTFTSNLYPKNMCTQTHTHAHTLYIVEQDPCYASYYFINVPSPELMKMLIVAVDAFKATVVTSKGTIPQSLLFQNQCLELFCDMILSCVEPPRLSSVRK